MSNQAAVTAAQTGELAPATFDNAPTSAGSADSTQILSEAVDTQEPLRVVA